MFDWTGNDYVHALFFLWKQWLEKNILTESSVLQLVVCVGLFLVGHVVGNLVHKRLDVWIHQKQISKSTKRFIKHFQNLIQPTVALILIWSVMIVAHHSMWPYKIISITVNLLSAWVMIRLVSVLFENSAFSKFVAWVAWGIAALNILGILDSIIIILEDLSFDLGNLKISIYSIIKGLFTFIILLWIAIAILRFVERRTASTRSISPTFRVLISKITKILLITIVVIISLNSVGIDLTAFAIVGGAIGVGLGFGLQKVFSNLVSGLILLMDKSVKPGDIITVGNTFGWINTLGARYVSVVTYDGHEHLIPNEELITRTVENWSFSNTLVRVTIPVGISYKSDPHHAIKLCEDIAKQTPRVLQEPPPVCFLTSFADSSIQLELRIWVADPINGLTNIKSKILLDVWDKFKEEGVEIPYPQREIHIKKDQDL